MAQEPQTSPCGPTAQPPRAEKEQFPPFLPVASTGRGRATASTLFSLAADTLPYFPCPSTPPASLSQAVELSRSPASLSLPSISCKTPLHFSNSPSDPHSVEPMVPALSPPPSPPTSAPQPLPPQPSPCLSSCEVEVEAVVHRAPKRWACQRPGCTSHQPFSHVLCVLCSTPREGGWSCALCTSINESRFTKCQQCRQGLRPLRPRGTGSKRRLPPQAPTSPVPSRKIPANDDGASVGAAPLTDCGGGTAQQSRSRSAYEQLRDANVAQNQRELRRLLGFDGQQQSPLAKRRPNATPLAGWRRAAPPPRTKRKLRPQGLRTRKHEHYALRFNAHFARELPIALFGAAEDVLLSWANETPTPNGGTCRDGDNAGNVDVCEHSSSDTCVLARLAVERCWELLTGGEVQDNEQCTLRCGQAAREAPWAIAFAWLVVPAASHGEDLPAEVRCVGVALYRFFGAHPGECVLADVIPSRTEGPEAGAAVCAALAAYVFRLTAVHDITTCVIEVPPAGARAPWWSFTSDSWWADDFCHFDLSGDEQERPMHYLDGADSSDARLASRVALAAELYLCCEEAREHMRGRGHRRMAPEGDVRPSELHAAAAASRAAVAELDAMSRLPFVPWDKSRRTLLPDQPIMLIGELIGLFDTLSCRHLPCYVKEESKKLPDSEYSSAVASALARKLPARMTIRNFHFFECLDPEASRKECRRQLAFEKEGLPAFCLEHSTTTRAAQRELALLSGIPVDEDGHAFSLKHHWYTLAVRVGTPQWATHLREQRTATTSGDVLAQWHRSDEWLVQGLNLSPVLIVERALRFCHRRRAQQEAEARPPLLLAPPPEPVADDAIFFVESFGGSAPLAREYLRQMRAEELDSSVWDEEPNDEDGKRLFVQVVDWTGTSGHEVTQRSMSRTQLDELGRENLLREDWLNVDLNNIAEMLRLSPPRRIGGGRRERVIDQIHFAFDCRTFSLMARNIHGRYIDSHFMGESHEAYEANIRFFHAVAFCFLMQFRNPQVIITWENPDATMRCHPLMRLLERPQQAGGLGLLRVELDMCRFSSRKPLKPTHFWVPREWSSDFYDESMHPRFKCNHSVGSHEQIGTDGSFLCCVVCGQKGNLVWCDFCPRAYHLECMAETGRERYGEGERESFECEICVIMPFHMLQNGNGGEA